MVQIAVDQNLVDKAQIFFRERGMDLTEAVNAFLRDAVQEQFTEEELTAAYDRGMKQIQEGKFVAAAWEDLERGGQTV